MHPGTSPPSVPSWRISTNSSYYAPTADRPVGTTTAQSIRRINTRLMWPRSACNTWTKITVPGQTEVLGQSQE